MKSLLELVSPAVPDLKLIRFKGYEALSNPFEFHLTLVMNGSVCRHLENIFPIGRTVIFQLNQSGKIRWFHGKLWRWTKMIGGMDRLCQLIVVPEFYFLKLDQDCGCFQYRTIPDIFETVCRQHRFYDFDLSGLSKRYACKRYLVQYNETTFDFLSRLLVEEGMDYYFSHEFDCHTMKLTDSLFQLPQWETVIEYQTEFSQFPGIRRWQTLLKETNGPSTLMRYSHKNPKRWKSLHEKFGDQPKYIKGEGNSIQFFSGERFKFREPVSNSLVEYCFYEVIHDAQDNTVLDPSIISSAMFCESRYRNSFTAIPLDGGYQPTNVQYRHKIGIQTAKVAGPHSNEPFTHPMGRVKVRFFWDRYASERDSTQSSCWIRVMQPWAGLGWGFQFLPRVGDEVLVGFRCGNPDEPMVMGSLYNKDHQLPFLLGQTGFKTNLLSGREDHEQVFQHHAFWFDENIGKESFNLQVAGLFSMCVDRNESMTIQRDYKKTVQKNETWYSAKAWVWKSPKKLLFSTKAGELLLTPRSIYVRGKQIYLN
jgi:type VI secretion system secreted protein VgrG